MLKYLKEITLNSIISFSLNFMLIILVPYLMYAKQYLLALSALAAVIISLTPAILRRNYNINMPLGISFLVTLVLYLHTIGISFRLYSRLPYYDVTLHIIGSMVVALLGFAIVYTMHFTKKVSLSIPLIGLFTVIFALAVGALWEVGEFAADQFLGTHAQPDNFDTMTDMIYDTVAGIITAIAAMFYVNNTPKTKLSEIIHPFDMLLSIKNKERFDKLSVRGHETYFERNEKG
ncbi:hypothetical protein J4231_03830 [Candidatus Woesearchaeota archaeon]|nr:hypothetical protein [Candidatus Woesearchaeota archaeon]